MLKSETSSANPSGRVCRFVTWKITCSSWILFLKLRNNFMGHGPFFGWFWVTAGGVLSQVLSQVSFHCHVVLSLSLIWILISWLGWGLHCRPSSWCHPQSCKKVTR